MAQVVMLAPLSATLTTVADSRVAVGVGALAQRAVTTAAQEGVVAPRGALGAPAVLLLHARRLGKPVLSANQVAIWSMLRLAGFQPPSLKQRLFQ